MEDRREEANQDLPPLQEGQNRRCPESQTECIIRHRGYSHGCRMHFTLVVRRLRTSLASECVRLFLISAKKIHPPSIVSMLNFQKIYKLKTFKQGQKKGDWSDWAQSDPAFERAPRCHQNEQLIF